MFSSNASKITVVASVISVQPQTTNYTYMLNDGTANMEARQWVDANTDEEHANKEEIKYASAATARHMS